MKTYINKMLSFTGIRKTVGLNMTNLDVFYNE